MPEELPDALKKIFKELNELPRSNQPGTLSRRIELCREALGTISKDTQSARWGKLQDDLASSLLEIPSRERAENIEQAIDHYNRALEVRTRAECPKDWAATQHNLGGAYLQRIQGDRAQNIEEAIKYYNRALEVRTRETDAPRWAMTQLNLAGAYYRRIRGERAENLEQALAHCNQALEVYTREASAYAWAQAENILGEIYRVRIRESRIENMEEAIRHFEQALSVHTRKDFPEEWAALQNNLTAAYTERLGGVRADNLECALQHARSALEVRTDKVFPEKWAETEYNLGNVYRYRVAGDPAENMEQAIHHFQQALTVRTREAFPEQWAEVQHCLGIAHMGRVRGEPGDNVQQAIRYFEQALTLYTRQAFPEPWAQAESNLGTAYLASGSDGGASRADRAERIEKAIAHYQQALKVRTQAAFPKDWAETHNRLVGAYAKRLRGKPGDNIEQAIWHLQETLKVYTQAAFPQDWAGVQHNLGNAYSERTRGVQVENIQKAIDHYQQALEAYTRLALTDHRLRTARALGNLAFKEQRWELARDTYDVAFAIQGLLMQASFSRAGKQTELAEVQNLPARAAYVHVQLNQMERAVEVMEQGRAQLLRESLERQRRDLEQLTALGFGRLYDEYQRATGQYSALQKMGEIERSRQNEDWISQMERALKAVQAATAAIREEAGKKHPEYRHFLQALSFEEIQKQARERTLVYLSATPAGGLALIVTGDGLRAVDLPELKQASLQEQIWRPTDREIDRINAHLQHRNITLQDIQAVSGGYFSTYALWSLTGYLIHASQELRQELFDAWQKTLDDTARWLWKVVMEKLVLELKPNQSIALIPAGHLALLPLHAAWTEDPSRPTGRRYVLDELSITYAPSAHALSQASLAPERSAESLLVVDNPDGSLPAAREEVRAALSMFKKVTHLPGDKATLEAVQAAMQHAQVLHFATHGNAGWQEENQARLKLADGYLTLPDIFELHLRQARLAVLSACETGVPSLKLIDEMTGLPAGMMQAGVPGVVGSLWSVNDLSTAMLMVCFYKFWQEDNRGPCEALRQAQIWLRDSTREQKKDFFKSFVIRKRSEMSTAMALSFYKNLSAAEPGEIDFSSPYYWAAFAYTGV